MGLSQGHASVVQGQIPEENKQGDLALSSSILATEFFGVNIPTRPRFLLQSTTFRSPMPHRRPQQRSPGSDPSTCKRSLCRGLCEMFDV